MKSLRHALALLLISCLLSPTLVYGQETSPAPSEEVRWEQRSEQVGEWIGNLPQHIGNDFKETFWNKWHLLALAAGTGLIVGVHQADSNLQNTFQTERPFGKTFDDVMEIGFHPLVLGGATLITLGASELFDGPVAKKVAVTAGTMLEAFVLTEAITVPLQFATQRARPDGSGNTSFPSGHSSGVFSLAAVATTLYGPWVGIPSFTLASLVGVSRLDGNKHFASDVLAGALLGTLMGIGTAKYHKTIFPQVFIVPIVSEDTAGLTLTTPF